MSVTERMENGGMTFQDAVDKEAGVSGIVTITNPSYAAYLGTPAGKIIAEQAARIAAEEKRFAEHLAAWIKNSEVRAERITALENALDRALSLVDQDEYDTTSLVEVLTRRL